LPKERMKITVEVAWPSLCTSRYFIRRPFFLGGTVPVAN
jgi:hypothetical protein